MPSPMNRERGQVQASENWPQVHTNSLQPEGIGPQMPCHGEIMLTVYIFATITLIKVIEKTQGFVFKSSILQRKFLVLGHATAFSILRRSKAVKHRRYSRLL